MNGAINVAHIGEKGERRGRGGMKGRGGDKGDFNVRTGNEREGTDPTFDMWFLKPRIELIGSI